MNKKGVVLAVQLALAGAWMECAAQDSSAPPPDSPVRPAAELDQLLGPVALYPDPLLGLIFPSATVPSQVVEADRYISQGGDPNQISVQPWDPSVQGLAHYPTVLKWMDDNIAWTTEVGVAFSVQQSDVMDSIQRLRSEAMSEGNLPSTPQENVDSDGGIIDIDPVDDSDMYVPDYSASLIYTQPGVFCTFGWPLPIGFWVGYDWDWRHHHLISWGPDHPRPQGWWHEPPGQRYHSFNASTTPVWRPRQGPIVVRGGGDRGYGGGSFSASFLPSKKATPGPRAREVPRPTPAPRVSETEASRPVERTEPRAEPSESAFGGSLSSREVHESSARGEQSRAASFGGGRSMGGGGGRPH